MKKFIAFSILVLLVSFAAAQKNFYVSSIGDDSNDGTIGRPWATVAKVNGFTFNNFDTVNFNAGDTWNEPLNVPHSFITVRSYNNGAKPILTSMERLTSWTAAGPGIYTSVVNTALNRLKIVTIDGIPQELGRYPNSDSINAGWLSYESLPSANSIKDNQLTSAPNWGGAQAVVRENHWTSQALNISNHSNGVLKLAKSWDFINGNYNNGAIVPGQPGYGYFIQDHIWTLNKFGEWWFDSTTKRLYVYFGVKIPSDFRILAATKYTGINIGNRSNVKISGLQVDGWNGSGIYASNTSNITVENCDAYNVGFKGVQMFQISNSIADNCRVRWALDGGIQLYSGNSRSDLIITRCKVSMIGQYAGMCTIVDQTGMNGIFIAGKSRMNVNRCRTDTTGRDGIRALGDTFTVEKNVCNYGDNLLADQAMIYTFQDGTDTATPPPYATSGKIVRDNLCMNAIGNPYGDGSAKFMASGLYSDGRNKKTLYINNLVMNCANNGIHANNPGNVGIFKNYFINCQKGISFFKWDWGTINNLSISGNIVYSKKTTQNAILYTNAALNGTALLTALQSAGTIDSNFYNNTNTPGWDLDFYDSVGKGHGFVEKNFASWKAYSGFDQNSTALPDVPDSMMIIYMNQSDTVYQLSLPGTYKAEKGKPITGFKDLQPYEIFMGFKQPDEPPLPVPGIERKYFLGNFKFLNKQ